MHDAMSIFGVRERMRHHHDSSPLLIEFRPQLHDLLAHRGVAISGRLIGQAQLRTRHRRTGNRHALLLFSRKLLRPVLGPMRGLHILQGGVHARLAVPWRQVFVVKQGLLNVLEHGQIIDLVEALKDEPDAVLAQLRKLPFAPAPGGHAKSPICGHLKIPHP